MKKKLAAALVFFLVLFVLLLRLRTETAVQPGRVNGSTGAVSGDEAVPGRIVALPAAAMEVLFDLGVGDKIVGAGSRCDYPPQVQSLEKVGRAYGSVNVELILGLNPDLVICSRSNASLFRERGIRTFVVPTCRLDQVKDFINDLGKVVGREGEAGGIAADMARRIGHVREKVSASGCRPLVYFEAGARGKTRAGGTLTHDLIDCAGGTNIAAGEPVPFPLLSEEYIISRDPDVIIAEESGPPVEEIKSRDGWQDVKAVRNGRVYRSPVFFTNYTPRCVEGLERYARWIHPDLFE